MRVTLNIKYVANNYVLPNPRFGSLCLLAIPNNNNDCSELYRQVKWLSIAHTLEFITIQMSHSSLFLQVESWPAPP